MVDAVQSEEADRLQRLRPGLLLPRRGEFMRISVASQPDEDLYPSSETEPMGETDFHMLCFILLREALEDLTRDLLDVYVASNLFLYYEERNPSARKAPDAMVVKGVKKGFRRTFKTWVEKAVPCTAFEIASKNTWPEDVEVKPAVYASIGIAEYFLFDPEGCYLRPRLQGFRLRKRRYEPLKPALDGSLTSKELGVRLVPEGIMLRLVDLQTGQPLPTRQEIADELATVKAELAALRATINKKGRKE